VFNFKPAAQIENPNLRLLLGPRLDPELRRWVPITLKKMENVEHLEAPEALNWTWQASQAIHGFIPCRTAAESEVLAEELGTSPIERFLQSLTMEGTCIWA
jgi:hypothetical protein